MFSKHFHAAREAQRACPLQEPHPLHRAPPLGSAAAPDSTGPHAGPAVPRRPLRPLQTRSCSFTFRSAPQAGRLLQPGATPPPAARGRRRLRLPGPSFNTLLTGHMAAVLECGSTRRPAPDRGAARARGQRSHWAATAPSKDNKRADPAGSAAASCRATSTPGHRARSSSPSATTWGHPPHARRAQQRGPHRGPRSSSAA